MDQATQTPFRILLSKNKIMDFKIQIREIQANERKHLDRFLYDAIFMPEDQEKPDKEIIKLPELSRYIKDFGRETDLCLVAELNGELIGAIWTRIYSEDEKGFWIYRFKNTGIKHVSH